MNELQILRCPIATALPKGLFTSEITDDPQEERKTSKTYQIVVRGYYKFFNIGEVPWTTVGYLFYILFLYISFLLLTVFLSVAFI
jgi:hypothetical protein